MEIAGIRRVLPGPILLLLIAAPGWSASYRILDLGTLGGASSVAYGLNRHGDVIGEAKTADGQNHAFLFRDGRMSDLTERWGLSSVWDINDRGQLVGDHVVSGATYAALFDGSQLRDLGTLGGSESYADALNESGQVAGHSWGPDDATLEAFIYDGDMRTLPGLFADISFAYDINDAGTLAGAVGTSVGYRAYYWDGVFHELGTLGGKESIAWSINNYGAVVGTSLVAGNVLNHAFYWGGAGMRDLGTLGGAESAALAVNDQGFVVGNADTAGGSPHAFVYDGARMRDLNDLIPTGDGWKLTYATDINEAGQIVGSGFLKGAERAFLLTPLFGDTNDDGVVNLTDFNNVRNDFGLTGDGLSGDANHDLRVDVTDLNLVRNHFGETNGANAVPEPSALMVALTVALVYWTARPLRGGLIKLFEQFSSGGSPWR